MEAHDLILELGMSLGHRVFELVYIECELKRTLGTMQSFCGVYESNRRLKMCILSVNIANVEVFLMFSCLFLRKLEFVHATEQINVSSNLENCCTNGGSDERRDL